jgi:hypothetical protein
MQKRKTEIILSVSNAEGSSFRFITLPRVETL